MTKRTCSGKTGNLEVSWQKIFLPLFVLLLLSVPASSQVERFEGEQSQPPSKPEREERGKPPTDREGGCLGVLLGKVEPEHAKSIGLERPYGAWVVKVYRDTGAFRAGILKDDIILELDGVEISDQWLLSETVSNKPPGTEVELMIFRNGKRIKLKAVLGELPKPKAPPTITLGLKVLKTPSEEGVLVNQVQPGSPAELAGIRKGDIILEINRHLIRQPGEYMFLVIQAKAKKTPILIRINRRGEHFFVAIDD